MWKFSCIHFLFVKILGIKLKKITSITDIYCRKKNHIKYQLESYLSYDFMDYDLRELNINFFK